MAFILVFRVDYFEKKYHLKIRSTCLCWLQSLKHIVQAVSGGNGLNIKLIATEMILLFFDSLLPITSLVKNLQKSTKGKLVYFPYLYYNPKGRKHQKHINTYVFINMSLKTPTVFNIVSKYLCKEQI